MNPSAMKRSVFVAASALAVGLALQPAFGQQGPGDASAATKSANAKPLQELPFANKQSFADAHKNFIASLPDEIVKTQDGHPVWDPKTFDFIKEGS